VFREGLVEGALVLFLFFVCLVWFGLVLGWKEACWLCSSGCLALEAGGAGKGEREVGARRGGGGGGAFVLSSNPGRPTPNNVVLYDFWKTHT
jgi:hypothetical protein